VETLSSSPQPVREIVATQVHKIASIPPKNRLLLILSSSLHSSKIFLTKIKKFTIQEDSKNKTHHILENVVEK